MITLMIDLHVSKRMQTGRPACAMHTCNSYIYPRMHVRMPYVYVLTEGSYANYIS